MKVVWRLASGAHLPAAAVRMLLANSKSENKQQLIIVCVPFCVSFSNRQTLATTRPRDPRQTALFGQADWELWAGCFPGANFCGSPVQSFEFALFAKVHFEFHSAINRQIRIGNSSHRSKVLCAANPSVCWILCSRASNEPLMSSIAESKFT